MSSLVTKIRRQTSDTAPTGVSVDASNRFLLKDGVPWLPNIAAGSWFIIQAISNVDSASYIDTLAAAGFNAVHMSTISNDVSRYPSDSGNHFAAPNWKNGATSVPPFTTPGNFSTWNSTYATHAKDRIDYALSKGLVPIANVSYVGYAGANGSSNEGFAGELAGDTDAHCQAYGSAIGNLLKTCTYLMYSSGGDCHPAVGSVIESRLLAIAAGVQSADPGRIMMAHLDGFLDGGEVPYDQANIGAITGTVWSHYCYNEAPKRARVKIAQAYAHSPTRPVVVLDPSYEGDPATSSRSEIRRRTHMTLCAGACSLAYARGDGSGTGTGWYWMTTSSWTTTLPGLGDHQIAHTFWSSLPWWGMVPDTGGVFVTAGRGTDSDTADDYVGVRASTACLVACFQDQSKTVTVNMAQFTGTGAFSGSGTRRARWVDPTNRSADVLISNSLTTSGTRTFGLTGTHTFPGNNSAGDHDLLLVID